MTTLLGWAAAAATTTAIIVLTRRTGFVGDDNASPWALAWLRLKRNGRAMLALYVVIALFVLAVLAPFLAPYHPHAQLDIIALRGHPPSAAHLLGTDTFSRDLLSRVLLGSRISLSVAVLSVIVAMSVGTAYGALSGYIGGRTDAVMMRLIDALLSIPRILLLIAVLALWGRVPLHVLVLLIGLTGWFGVSRLVRAQVLATRDLEYVLSARALGARDSRLLMKHVLPNVLSPVIVAATLGVGNVIILEAGLSYLGIGVRPPEPSWGNIIQDGVAYLSSFWWISLFPGLAIVGTVMAFNTLGDGLRDALDPRHTETPL